MYLVVYKDISDDYVFLYHSLDELLHHYNCYTIDQVLLNENKNGLNCKIYQVSYVYSLKDEFYRY